MTRLLFRRRWWWVPLVLGGLACAQDLTITGRVALAKNGKTGPTGAADSAVLWLVPVEGSSDRSLPAAAVYPHPQLLQKNKRFQPHLLVVPVGSVVEFPNHDPFFHNVFSLFEGKRFDLGLYEAGSTKEVLFDKPGVSYIFCDIHAEMSAVIIALTTPYYGISDRRGQVLIPHVPPGRYALHIWYEAALPEQLNAMTREIALSENNSSFGVLRLAAANRRETHKNKYGQDYDPPTPDNSTYPRP
jgi:plastocyanin